MNLDLTKFAFFDFETEAIKPRPHYPPRPVGLAHWLPPNRPGYLAFAHPTIGGDNGDMFPHNPNTHDRHQVLHFLKDALRTRVSVWHHAGFDLDVMETHLGIPWPADHGDTLLLAFLHDPLDPGLHLKDLAERWLGEPPTERDELQEWILRNIKEAKKSDWGAYISLAPVPLVAKYAIGDVRRTRRLFEFYWKQNMSDARLRGAYEREKKVTRTLIKMERRGISIDHPRLVQDIKKYDKAQARLEASLMDRLKVPKTKRDEFKFSGKFFPEQLLRCGAVTGLPKTKKGNYSVSMDVAAPFFKDPRLARDLEVRSQLQTCLETFMRTWAEMAGETGGTCYLRFNQTRSPEGFGARTGRLSSSPNWQNLIRGDKDARVPRLRGYVVPGPFAALAQRDYSQQELRFLAHFENGRFLQAYLANPTMDAHLLVRDLIYAITTIMLERRPVKDINFGVIYGMGLKKTARKLGVEVPEARRLLKAHAQALPDVTGPKGLRAQLEARADAKEPIWTWGGRRYYCEPPRFVPEDGRWWTFEYKLLNVLIQGSAADCTKQAMVNYDSYGAFADDHPILLQVHDELINGVRRVRDAKRVHLMMSKAMLDVDVAVPMLSDGKLSRVSWQAMEKVKW